jgi:hypothetical protein
VCVFFWFEDGAWCWLRPHQEALCCLISLGLLLSINRKTEKPNRFEREEHHLRRHLRSGLLQSGLPRRSTANTAARKVKKAAFKAKRRLEAAAARGGLA